MGKHLADASGPAVFFTWVIDKFIPVTTPIVIYLGAIAGLIWYGIRFYEYFKHKRLGD